MTHRLDQMMWDQLFRLTPNGGTTLQGQLREMLVSAILDGHIPVGSQLPSCRELARQLGVARNTVVIAYQHLVDDGYLIPRERSGYFVNADILSGRVAQQHHSKPLARIAGRAEWSNRFKIKPSGRRNIIKLHNWRDYPYPFVYGEVDPEMIPIADWRECCRETMTAEAIREWSCDGIDRDDHLLLEQIQIRLLPRRGVWASQDEILITLGAQHALYLLASLLVDERTSVGVEEPGYPDARNIFALRTPKVIGLAIDGDGLVANHRLNACDYLYTTPSHQSPTMVTMSLERRKALLRRALAADFVVIEDDYESETNFVGEPTPAMKGFDTCGRVIYVGSLSRTLAPGLRLGYLVGPAELVRELRVLRRLMVRHPPANNQRSVALFLARGHYDSLLRRLNHVGHERWQAMGDALDRYLPELRRPQTSGGTSYWVEGPKELDAAELQRMAATRGILIETGGICFTGNTPPQNYFRLGFSSIDTDRIAPGIERLAKVIHEMVRRW